MGLIVSQAIRIFTAALSCLSSSTIAIMILISDTGLQSPYSRIIFGLSIGDIMQSGGIIISPFAVPGDTPDAPWARGNVETCEATGFFLFIGSNIVPFYTIFLSYYFLKRVKDKVTPKDFARKYELVIHLITWLYTIIAGFIGLARDNFNPSGEGSVCIMMDNPKSCSTDPEIYGQCIRGKSAPKDSIFTVVLPLVLSCFAIIVNLLRLTIHVYFEEKLLRESRQSDNAGAEVDKNTNGCCHRHNRHQGIETEPPSDQEDKVPQNQATSLAMQSLGQSSLYICACILVNFFPVVAYIFAAIGKPRPDFVHWGVSFFWPLGGFLNILIYTRPKVTKMRRIYPELSHISWFVMFLVIVVSGGEVPEIDLGSNDVSTAEDAGKDENAERGIASNAITTARNLTKGENDMGNMVLPSLDELVGTASNVSTSARNFTTGEYGMGNMVLSSLDELVGETDSQNSFQRELKGALADSSGADSFLRSFHKESGPA